MGIVVRTRNVGAAVRAFTVAEVEEIYDVREMVQRQAALRIRLPASPADIAKLEAIQAEYVRCVEAGDLRGIHASQRPVPSHAVRRCVATRICTRW